MAESNYGSIGPLNGVAQKEATELLILIIVAMAATVVLLCIVGMIANAIL